MYMYIKIKFEMNFLDCPLYPVHAYPYINKGGKNGYHQRNMHIDYTTVDLISNTGIFPMSVQKKKKRKKKGKKKPSTGSSTTAKQHLCCVLWACLVLNLNCNYKQIRFVHAP